MTDVLWLVPNKPDNISTGRQRIAQGLRDRGHTVTLCDDRREFAGKQYRNGYDVLVSSSLVGGVFGPPARFLQGKAFVMDHVDPVRQMHDAGHPAEAFAAEILHRVAFRAADGILYVYGEERDRVTGHGATVEQTTLGVDYDRFAGPPNPTSAIYVDELLQSNGIDRGYATYIGGLEPIYNIPALLAAAESGEWPLVVAGAGYYEEQVRAAAQRCDNIAYLGVLDHEHMPALLHRAGAGICLVDDRHTVKVLEYAAADLPIVHLDGRARAQLPDAGVHWVPQHGGKAGPITSSVREALDARRGSDALTDYARDRDYGRIVHQYDAMLRDVVGDRAPETATAPTGVDSV